MSIDGPEVEGLELISLALVELVLELHPMEPESVQETFHAVHADQDPKCDRVVAEKCK